MLSPSLQKEGEISFILLDRIRLRTVSCKILPLL